MRFTRHQVLVSSLVKNYPAILRTRCGCCDSLVWLEMMYRTACIVQDASGGCRKEVSHICKTCAPTKEKAYDMVFPKMTTAQDIIIKNAHRQMAKAIEKADLAAAGLKKIIEQAIDPNAAWNPNQDEFVARTLVEAENTLRIINGEQKSRQNSSN